MTNVPTMTEFFGWRFHPFADTWRLKEPFFSPRDQRIADQSLQLLRHGKSFAITGPSGAGKSTFVQHLMSALDANYYRPMFIHYQNSGGIRRAA